MKLVILDRDGVINYDSSNYIKNADEWIPIPGSLESIAKLNKNGFKVVIASNQGGIGKGLFDVNALSNINKKISNTLKLFGGEIDKFFYCLHTDLDKCDCRKPKTGLLVQINEYYKISLKDVPAIGDSQRDLVAFDKVKAQPILVKTGNGEQTFLTNKYPKNTWIFNNLSEAIDEILKKY